MFVLTINAYSQKLVKEYYDWAKTKIKREYYTDAYGTLNGSYKAYSEYGGIMKQGQCKNDAPIGKWIENYDNGKLHFIKIYDSPGTYNFQVKDGKIISYYEDGKTIKYERNYKNMELDGVWKEYDEKGVLIKEGKYVNGVFEPTGITKIKLDELQEKEKQRQAIEYKNILPEADNAFLAKDYKKALELYKSASELMVKEKYPKDRISEILETYHSNSKFFIEYTRGQYDSIQNEFKKQTSGYKLVVIKLLPGQSFSPQYEYNYDKMRDKPCWYEYNWNNAQQCFTNNRKFYEAFQIAFVEGYLKYNEALSIEEGNVNKSGYRFNFDNTNNQFYTYDKNTFLANLKKAKNDYELGKSVGVLYKTVIEKKNQVTTLNDQNKKKTLLKKYLIVYEDLIAKYNEYESLTETVKVLNTISSLSDKVINYYSQDTKELESKLKEVETSTEIQAILLGQ
jgi:antitoxin component YwqK of YwqJK toxin-antitoxin module